MTSCSRQGLRPGLICKNKKDGKFAKRQLRLNDISHICVMLLQCNDCNPSEIFSSLYDFVSSFSIQKSELWIPQTKQISVLKFWVQQELQATLLEKDFCPGLKLWSFKPHCLRRTFARGKLLSHPFADLQGES